MGIRSKIEVYINGWEKKCYSNGIPDFVPTEISWACPSYKKIAIAILSNDHPLKSLGFEPKQSKYYDSLKKIELSKRGVSIQLKLF